MIQLLKSNVITRALMGSSLLLLCIAMSACEKEVQAPALPQGVQTMTGTLLPAEISLTRRGTHILQKNGRDVYFVESTSVSLRKYEQKQLRLEGVIEHNVDPKAYPVFVVSKILDVAEISTKEWKLWTYGITVEAPKRWTGTILDSRVEFTIPTVSGSIVSVYKKQFEELPSGDPIVVDDRRAVRIIDQATGSQKVIVAHQDSYLVLEFSPQNSDDSLQLRESWLAMLQSIQFHDSPADTSGAQTPIEAGSDPCGGPAGILCADGYYCDVTHIEENIGICRKI